MFRSYQTPITIGVAAALVSGAAHDASAGAVCPIASPAACQTPDDSLEFRYADGHYHYPIDDFRPVSETMSSVCIWGRYAKPVVDEHGQRQLVDCADTYGVQEFAVIVYGSDTSGLPNYLTELSWQLVSSFDRTYVAGTAAEAATGIRTYAYHLPLPEPITGMDTSGSTCYWFAVSSNSGEGVVDRKCDWYWQTSGAVHNDVTALLIYPVVADLAVRYGDMAFCLNCGVEPGACGARTGYCCACDGTCRDVSFRECHTSGDNWHINSTCADAGPEACPTGPPANDTCVVVADPGYPSLPVGASVEGITYDNYCATGDGVNPVRTEWSDGVQIEGDVWFKYQVADGGDHIDFGSGAEPALAGGFDSMLAVYHDPENPEWCICPSTPAEHDAWLQWPCDVLAGLVSDDNWAPYAGGGHVFGPLDRDGCYMIRIGDKRGAEQAHGKSSMYAAQLSVDPFPPWPVADTAGHDRNRYMPFSVEPDGRPVGVRVRVVSVPAYPALAGVEFWVGPPRYVPDEDASDPTKTFQVAPLQCEPYNADWGSLGRTYVYGAEIVPGGQYEIETVLQACCRADSLGCVGWPIDVATGRFGDVAPLFGGPGIPPQPDFAAIRSASPVVSFVIPGGDTRTDRIACAAESCGALHEILAIALIPNVRL